MMIIPASHITVVSYPTKQEGAALIMTLLFLMILTVLSVSGAKNTVIQEKMSGSVRDLNVAFNAAESGLVAGERWNSNQSIFPVPTTDGSTKVWTYNGADPSLANSIPWWNEPTRDASWWLSNATALGSLHGLAQNPHYIVEEVDFMPDSLVQGVGNPPGRYFHRVTARGWGGSDKSKAMVQSYYVSRR
jgi:type IV pilus assembly protein PilX